LYSGWTSSHRRAHDRQKSKLTNCDLRLRELSWRQVAASNIRGAALFRCGQEYEVEYFARKHGITAEQARQLIKEHGNSREVLLPPRNLRSFYAQRENETIAASEHHDPN
jgi:hypothetical protein